MGKLAPRALHRIITVEDYWHCQEAGLLKRGIKMDLKKKASVIKSGRNKD